MGLGLKGTGTAYEHHQAGHGHYSPFAIGTCSAAAYSLASIERGVPHHAQHQPSSAKKPCTHLLSAATCQLWVAGRLPQTSLHELLALHPQDLGHTAGEPDGPLVSQTFWPVLRALPALPAGSVRMQAGQTVKRMTCGSLAVFVRLGFSSLPDWHCL